MLYSQKRLVFGIDQNQNLWQWGTFFGETEEEKRELYGRDSHERDNHPAPLEWFKEKQLKCLDVRCGGSFAVVKTQDKDGKFNMYVISNGYEGEEK